MKFSERYGLSAPRMPLAPDEMPDGLRNRLWSVIRTELRAWRRVGTDLVERPDHRVLRLWDMFYKWPLDTVPYRIDTVVDQIRKLFFDSRWDEVYDLMEFIVELDTEEYGGISPFSVSVNAVLEEELAAWRFIGLHLQRITDQGEIEAVSEGANSPLVGVKMHVRTALACLAQRPDPDTRNAIKEAVSAVESAAKSVTGRDKAVFTALAQRLGADGVHPQFVQAWKNLYNYTSDAGAVRHGAKAGDQLPSVDEAKLFVVTASAFVNYLVAHYGAFIRPI